MNQPKKIRFIPSGLAIGAGVGTALCVSSGLATGISVGLALAVAFSLRRSHHPC